MRTKEYQVKIWFERESKIYVINASKNGKMIAVTQGRTFVEAFEMLGEAIQIKEDKK